MCPKKGDGHLNSVVWRTFVVQTAQTEIRESEPSFLTKFLIHDCQRII